MKTSEPLRELITAKAAATTIRRKAAEEGMRSLREDAMSALLAGETTVEEVLKHT